MSYLKVVSDCTNIDFVDPKIDNVDEQKIEYLKKLVEKIPANQIKKAVQLRYWSNLKKQEMLSLMNVDNRTFDTYVSRGNAFLRKMIATNI